MIIRLAGPADAAPLAELGAHCFTVKFGSLYRPEDLAAYLSQAYVEPTLAAEIADPDMRVFVAQQEDGGPLLGYCKLVMACGWPQHARGRRPVEIKQLYTHPDAIGQGIGRRLMDVALAEIRQFGGDEIQLSVWSGNPDAQRFYARYGFVKVADTHFMVGQHRDEEYLFAVRLNGT